MSESSKRKLLNEVNKIYPTINFNIIENDNGIQLLHDSEENEFNDIFFDSLCDIAIKYLNTQEQNRFSILFDNFNEMNYLQNNQGRVITVNEVIKMLRNCTNGTCGDECVFYDYIECKDKLIKLAVDLLEQLTAENDQLKTNQPVTCGECKYCDHDFEGYFCYKGITDTDLKETDYCSYGERRVEDENR